MKRLDRYERDILSAYEKGALVSAHPSKAQRNAFREAASATFIKNRRVNIRLSAADLLDRPRRMRRVCRIKRSSRVCFTSTYLADCRRRGHV
jgi:hypothetical protein